MIVSGTFEMKILGLFWGTKMHMVNNELCAVNISIMARKYYQMTRTPRNYLMIQKARDSSLSLPVSLFLKLLNLLLG